MSSQSEPTAKVIEEHFRDAWRAHVAGCGFCAVVLDRYEREAARIRAEKGRAC